MEGGGGRGRAGAGVQLQSKIEIIDCSHLNLTTFFYICIRFAFTKTVEP